MDGAEYLRKRRLLKQFEALATSPAYEALQQEIVREHGNCIAGLRNRKKTVEERQEYLEGADVTERLAAYVATRISQLKADTTLTTEEIAKLNLESDDL